jgi:hypothetical protein
MTRLTSLALARDAAFLRPDDDTQDTLLIALIEEASDEVERYCCRSFTKSARVEQFRAYNQEYGDPTPQYVWLDGPVDLAQPFVVTYTPPYSIDPFIIASQITSTTLQAKDYALDSTKGLLLILPTQFYYENPLGFTITYTGGYIADSDGFIAGPAGLQMIVANKVAEGFMDGKALLPWSDDEKKKLNTYRKQNVLF